MTVFYHLSYTRIATGVSCSGSALGQKSSHILVGETEPTTLAIALTPNNKSDHFTTQPLRRTNYIK